MSAILVSRRLVLAASTGLLAAGIVLLPVQAASAVTQPNIVFIVADDQAEGTMDAMPIVRSEIRAQGVTFSNGIIPTSTCCPSRTTLLTGQYSHTTGVYQNTGPNGGWPAFYAGGGESHTLPVALHDVGYTTAMFGKYLNGYSLADDSYVPPGWDQFRAIYDPTANPLLAAGAYYNYILHGTGPDEPHADAPADYSTDVIADLAVQFITDTPAEQPLFLYWAPSGPHAPYTAAPRHIGTWHDELLNPAASQLTRHRPDFMPDQLLRYGMQQNHLRMQHETLMSVDEGVGDILAALGPERAANTIFVYLSDNGVQFGEHGLADKEVPYSGSTDVPMFIRWDSGFDAGQVSDTLMTNADLTVTVAQAVGVSLVDPDGVAFQAADRPNSVLLEGAENSERPSYCSVRTDRFVYTEYTANTGTELFDYSRDPDELVNAVGNARYVDKVTALKVKVRDLCSPVPPGFTWN